MDFAISTDSTSYSTAKSLSLDIPELEGLLPHAEAIWLEALLLNCADNEINWNIDARVGYDRDNEGSPVAFLAADQTLSGSTRVDSSLASSNHRRHARLTLKWKLHTGISVMKQARISLTLYVKTVGT